MDNTDRLNSRQFTALAFLASFSPLIRTVPAQTVKTAGSGAWLCALLSALPLALALLLAFRLGGHGKGMCETLCEAFGRFAGKCLLLVYFLWFIYLAAFSLRSGAGRVSGSIFPGSRPELFMLVMLPACLPAAMGRLKVLGRVSMLFRPVLLAVLAVAFISALPKCDFSGVCIPETGLDSLVSGCLTVAGPVSLCALLAFAGDQASERLRPLRASFWLGLMLLCASLLCLCAVGFFGPEMAGKLRLPFFAMVRDVGFFGAVERIDALVVALWVFCDFVELSLLLYLTAKILRFLFGMESGSWSWKLAPVPSAVCTLVLGLLLSDENTALYRLAEAAFIPGSLVFSLILPALAFITTKCKSPR